MDKKLFPLSMNLDFHHHILTGQVWARGSKVLKWSNLDRNLQAWREDVIATLCSITTDHVIFSHFIAINAAVGFAIEDDRVVSFRPDNASITVVETNGNSLYLVKLGDEADSKVN